MLAGFLTILGLLVAFYEKEHLFKKPITLKKISIVALLGLAAMISFVKDISNGIKSEKSEATIDSLNARSYTLNEQISSLRKENKDSQKEYADSIVRYHNYTTDLLAKYGLKVDTLTNEIRKFDTSIKKEALPTLTIIAKPFIKILNNEKIISYTVNSLNADAHIINYQYGLLSTQSGKTPNDILIYGEPIYQQGILNFTTIIPNGAWNEIVFFIDRVKVDIKLTDEFVLIIDFKYQSQSGKPRPPMRKMYLVKYSTNSVNDVSTDFYKTVELHIKRVSIKRGATPKQ